MMKPRRCDTCGRVIVVEAHGNSPGDHDPAYHVAVAYHFDKHGQCASCSKPFPCPTIVQFGHALKETP